MNSIATAPRERFLDETKALACIHCGLCLGSCPTYLETSNENESPRGRIYLMRAIQDGRLALSDTAAGHIDSCLGCRACEVACPSGVHYGELLEHTRDYVEKHYRRSMFQTILRKFVIEKVFPYPGRMKLALAPAKLIRFLGIENFLPKFAREAMSLIPDSGKVIPLPELSHATEKSRGRVGFVSGCVMSVMFSETNAASVRLLNRAGYDVATPKGQSCCGGLFAHSGNLAEARECARRNIEVFERGNFAAIIINAAGCGSTLKEYEQLLSEDPKWKERGKAFSAKVKDLTEWLTRDKATTGNHETSSGASVTYHDACHLAHAQRITKPPRELMKSVAGNNFVELPESDVCCGSAGTYNLTEPEMAERLQARKIENILKSGASVVVTSNPGCLLQIQAGLRKAGSSVKAMHIADFLEASNTQPKS